MKYAAQAPLQRGTTKERSCKIEVEPVKCDFCVFGHLCRVQANEACTHFAPLDDWQIDVEEEETVREAFLDAWFAYTDPDEN